MEFLVDKILALSSKEAGTPTEEMIDGGSAKPDPEDVFGVGKGHTLKNGVHLPITDLSESNTPSKSVLSCCN